MRITSECLNDRLDRLAWWLAWHIPRRVALYAFVRVYAVLGTCGNDYSDAYQRWEVGEGQ